MSDPLSPERADALAKMSPDEIEAELRGLIARGADAVPLLLELEARAPDREWRKRVRRALHQLKSRGVAIERPEASGEGSVLRPVALREEQGVVAPIDPIGRRMVLLLQPGVQVPPITVRHDNAQLVPAPREEAVFVSNDGGVLQLPHQLYFGEAGFPVQPSHTRTQQPQWIPLGTPRTPHHTTRTPTPGAPMLRPAGHATAAHTHFSFCRMPRSFTTFIT